jgi:hypothetical protein
MKAETYNTRTGFVSKLTEEQKNLIKYLYLDKNLSMSKVSRQSGITLGIVQKFIKQEGFSRDRIEALKQYHRIKNERKTNES